MRIENYDKQGLESVVEILRVLGVPTFRRFLRPDFTTPSEQRPADTNETAGLVAEEAEVADKQTWTTLQAAIIALPANNPVKAILTSLMQILKYRNRWE